MLGGGIEVDAVDLATFGWKVLSGQIVAPSARDNRLFSAVQPGCGTSTSGACAYGLSWKRGGDNGRRILEHGGSWRGARSHLRLYRKKSAFPIPGQPGNDELVIAIMSNSKRDDHNPATLATKIAAEIWASETAP